MEEVTDDFQPSATLKIKGSKSQGETEACYERQRSSWTREAEGAPPKVCLKLQGK